MVVKRFLTCFYPSYDYKKIRIDLTAEGETFSAAGREIIELGWKKVEKGLDEDDEEAAEQVLPSLHQGDTFLCKMCIRDRFRRAAMRTMKYV